MARGNMQSITSSIPCNLCNGHDVDVLSARDRHNRPLQTVICHGCGLVWTDPRPDSEANRKFYAEEYRQKYKATYRPKMKHVYRDMLRALQRYERIRPLLREGMKVLDIGAGAGFFPYVIRQHGFEITGLEPNDGYSKYANQEFDLNVINGFIEDAEFDEHSFDIITLNHVLEHLQDPCMALTRLRTWLKPGGYLNVEVPNIEATYHSPNNKFHLAHLYTFNPENLYRLGEKAGYTVSDVQLAAATRHINILFQKPAGHAPRSSFDNYFLAGNYDSIRKVFDAHTPLAHFLSSTPYSRLFRKLAGYLREKVAVGRFESGRQLADYLLNKN